ncbi:MAG: VWA domain-containing protein [Planctomycetales bacterium]|nr:VWA domain-containing protein [Planctomycetales bacterium]
MKQPLLSVVTFGVNNLFLVLLVGLSGCGSTQRIASYPAVESTVAEAAPQDLVTWNTESYDALAENDFLVVMEEPQSTFSIDVDTASYANVRRLLNQGTKPPAGAVRLEELVNYFSYDYPEPQDEHPFSVSSELAICPWNEDHQLLRIGLRGKAIDFEREQPVNLVFLLDVSGSMQSTDKLPLVKSALRLLIDHLPPGSRIALTAYAGSSGVILDSTSIAQSGAILEAIDNLQAHGSTNGAEGIELAYSIATKNFVPDGINRVILCTDGDFNVGITNHSDLVDFIERQAETGVYLSVLGFGTGNLKDSTMEKLADHGNGNYAYVDSLLEARKVLVEQVGGTLVTIAKDVKIQLDFNPQYVYSYRLLGYENRLLANQDFRDDAKDAGEIGAGHCVTAFYELVPPGSASVESSNSRPSEFVTTQALKSDSNTMLSVNLRYKLPAANEGLEFQIRVPYEVTQNPSRDFQFASSVLAYGMLLRDSKYKGKLDWDWVIGTASNYKGQDENGMRTEFVQLAKLGKRIAK